MNIENLTGLEQAEVLLSRACDLLEQDLNNIKENDFTASTELIIKERMSEILSKVYAMEEEIEAYCITRKALKNKMVGGAEDALERVELLISIQKEELEKLENRHTSLYNNLVRGLELRKRNSEVIKAREEAILQVQGLIKSLGEE